MTAQENYEEMAQVQQRLVELLHCQKNRWTYRKRTETAVELVQQIEAEGQFPQAPLTFVLVNDLDQRPIVFSQSVGSAALFSNKVNLLTEFSET